MISVSNKINVGACVGFIPFLFSLFIVASLSPARILCSGGVFRHTHTAIGRSKFVANRSDATPAGIPTAEWLACSSKLCSIHTQLMPQRLPLEDGCWGPQLAYVYRDGTTVFVAHFSQVLPV